MNELEQPDFAGVARRHLARSGYNVCQLSRLTGLPRMTVVNWLEGQVKKPRAWHDVVRLARALHLNRAEADELLRVAGYPVISRLYAQIQDDQEREMLSDWVEERTVSEQSPPFLAIPNLPTFVGREETLQTLEALLLGNDHNTVYVLEGTAGVGKTALAARLAYRLQPHLPDGVLWARLDTMDVMSILRLFAEAYNRDVTGYDDLGGRSQAVRQLLAHKRAIVVLDNVDSSREIYPLLPPSGPCAVVVTTRRRNLSLAHGARRFYVEPFTAEKGQAMTLFARVLGEEPVAREQKAFTDMADLLGHLPLAVDIVACRLAYEPGWTAVGFLQKLRQENGRLSQLVYEERCVRTALESSYALLTTPLQRFFAALGTLNVQDFSVETAAAVAHVSIEETATNLRTLFCLSLVLQGQRECYRLTPILHSFAREKGGLEDNNSRSGGLSPLA